MATYYIDTSALVKYYVPEVGTEFVKYLIDDSVGSDTFHTSFLTVLEFASALWRHQRITSSAAISALNSFGEDAKRFFRFWPVQHELITEALSEVQRFRLRSNDMIHLISAQNIARVDGNIAETIIVTSDRELIAASNSAGLNTIDQQAPNSLQWLAQIRASQQ